MKNSPYVGWFRHAPPSVFQKHMHSLSGLEKELMMILQSMPIPQQKNGVFQLADLLSGHLKGGTKEYSISIHDNDRHQTLEYFCRSLQASSAESSSVTLKVLTKVVCWFLLPFHDCDEHGHPCHHHTHHHHGDSQNSIHNKSLYSYSSSSGDGDDQETLTSCEEEDELLDNYDTVAGSGHGVSSQHHHSQQHFYETDLSVSSQAEAYYAHRTAEERINPLHTQEDYYLDHEGDHRLDYVITQIDIARMARNASRHLDVESITQLPTITYHAKEQEEQEQVEPAQPQQRHQDPEGWSWMMVQQKGLEEALNDSILPDEKKKDDKSIDKEQDVCVICLEHFLHGDRLRVLPCNHSFHVGCIDRWLSGSHSFQDCDTSGCPTCKKHPCTGAAEENQASESSDGSVPSWAFARIGSALAQNSRHF
jgi:hypothetical protein